MTIEEFLVKTDILQNGFIKTRPRIVCLDGFSMSVQAGYCLYSDPRESDDVFPFKQVEIGFPSEPEDLLLSYAEDNETPTQTVYGYVPIDIVQQVIDKHGGIDEEKTFKTKEKI